MALNIIVEEGVKHKVMDLAKALVIYTNEAFPDLPDTTVLLRDTDSVDLEDIPSNTSGDYTNHGCFVWWPNPKCSPEIHLAAKAPRKKANFEIWRIEFADTYFHELAHLLQYAEGKQITELGVKIRADNLMKQAVNNSEKLCKRIYG